MTLLHELAKHTFSRRNTLSFVNDEQTRRLRLDDNVFRANEFTVRECHQCQPHRSLDVVALVLAAPEFSLLVDAFHATSGEHHLHSQRGIVTRAVEEGRQHKVIHDSLARQWTERE